jgi:hypothetical protein
MEGLPSRRPEEEVLLQSRTSDIVQAASETPPRYDGTYSQCRVSCAPTASLARLTNVLDRLGLSMPQLLSSKVF